MCALPGLWALPAASQQQAVLSLQATATATSNSTEVPANPESDLLWSIRPRLQFARKGAGLSVKGFVETDFVGAAQNTRPERVLPYANLEVGATLIDRWMSLEAFADVRQAEKNLYGPRVTADATADTWTYGTYRLSPVLEHEFSSTMFLQARADLARVRYAGTDQGDTDTTDGVVRFGLKPSPLGAIVEWKGDDTNYVARPEADVHLRSFAGLLSAAVSDELELRAGFGRERSEINGNRFSDATRLIGVHWLPSPRTEAVMTLEDRFFGHGWSIAARHRLPSSSFTIRAIRDVNVGATAWSSASSLAGFLDAILTSRMPDGTARQEFVDGLITSRGLQNVIQGVAGAPATYPQLRRGNEFNWVFLLPRTTLSLSAYWQELQQVQRTDGQAVTLVPATEDSRQYGAALEWNRRLAPQLALDVVLERSDVRGLSLRQGDLTRQGTLRTSLILNATPATSLTVGFRYRKVASNVPTANSFNETAAFAGLGHRF